MQFMQSLMKIAALLLTAARARLGRLLIKHVLLKRSLVCDHVILQQRAALNRGYPSAPAKCWLNLLTDFVAKMIFRIIEND